MGMHTLRIHRNPSIDIARRATRIAPCAQGLMRLDVATGLD